MNLFSKKQICTVGLLFILSISKVHAQDFNRYWLEIGAGTQFTEMTVVNAYIDSYWNLEHTGEDLDHLDNAIQYSISAGFIPFIKWSRWQFAIELDFAHNSNTAAQLYMLDDYDLIIKSKALVLSFIPYYNLPITRRLNVKIGFGVSNINREFSIETDGFEYFNSSIVNDEKVTWNNNGFGFNLSYGLDYSFASRFAVFAKSGYLYHNLNQVLSDKPGQTLLSLDQHDLDINYNGFNFNAGLKMSF